MHAMEWLLFFSATLGHAALVTYLLNWIHGIAMPHKFQGLLKWLAILLMPAAVALFWWVSGTPVAELIPAVVAGSVATFYAVVCAVTGLVLPGLVLGQYLLRRPAVAQLSNHTRVVDVAAELGYRPEGRGKYRFLTRLPGNQVLTVALTEKTLSLPQLPAALDGLTILHLSDFHFCPAPDKAYHRQVIDHCAAWGTPDLVAFTGDIVDSAWHHCWIVPIFGRLRWHVAAYAVLGNHDHWHDIKPIQRRFRRIGFRLPGNSWEELSVRGTRIAVIGNEAPWVKPAPDLTGCPEDVFRLCLSHSPDNIYWAQAHAIDLVLAGHVHGGQIRLPVVGPIHVPSRYGRRFACGTFEEPPTVMHVSRGLAGQEPIRFNCRPEVTWLTLRRRAAEA